MKTGGWILALVGALFPLEAGLAQPADFPAQLPAPPSAINSQHDAEFKAVFSDWHAPVAALAEPVSADGDRLVIHPSREIGKCRYRAENSVSLASDHWALFATGEYKGKKYNTYVDAANVNYCLDRDDHVIANHTKKMELSGNAYFITNENYDCFDRETEYDGKGWIYFQDGRVVENSPGDFSSNPIPISDAYRLMKFICDVDHDRSASFVPKPQLKWLLLPRLGSGPVWALLDENEGDSEADFGLWSPDGFWVRKDYSGIKWTKYRYTYSFDSIDCADARYSAGTVYGFLPGAAAGEEVHFEDPMWNIAPNSNQAAVMARVCGSR